MLFGVLQMLFGVFGVFGVRILRLALGIVGTTQSCGP